MIKIVMGFRYSGLYSRNTYHTHPYAVLDRQQTSRHVSSQATSDVVGGGGRCSSNRHDVTASGRGGRYKMDSDLGP
jgi:hypothetical protein